MFGFGAISEAPLSTLPGRAVTHTASVTLNAAASTVNVPSLEVHLVSGISASATATAAGQLTKLGTSSLSASGTVAAAGELTKFGTTSLSPSATIDAFAQPLSPSSTLSGSATVSGSGALTKIGVAALSASASVLNEFELHIGAASLLADIGTLSGNMVGALNRNAGGLPSSATVSSNETRIIHVDASINCSASTSSTGVVVKLGQAHISTLGSFTSGFTQGFDRGTFLSGRPFIGQNHLSAFGRLSASGTLEKFGGSISMPAIATMTATFIFEHGAFANLQSIGSLSGNSVLLHGGSVDLRPLARIQARPSGDYAKPDIIQIALYVDKLREITANIDKTRSVTGYIDKQISIDSKIDLSSGVTSYIDKIVEKTLVRER